MQCWQIVEIGNIFLFPKLDSEWLGLTHCGQVMEIWVNIGSGNGLLPEASSHYLNHVDFPSSAIHLKAMWASMLKISISKFCFKLEHFKSQPHFPGDSELRNLFSIPLFALLPALVNLTSGGETSSLAWGCVSCDMYTMQVVSYNIGFQGPTFVIDSTMCDIKAILLQRWISELTH